MLLRGQNTQFQYKIFVFLYEKIYYCALNIGDAQLTQFLQFLALVEFSKGQYTGVYISSLAVYTNFNLQVAIGQTSQHICSMHNWKLSSFSFDYTTPIYWV